VRLITFIVVLLAATCGSIVAQECPDLLAPTNGATNVAVDTTISWQPVAGVTGYIISIGTTPGGIDIIEEQQVGSGTSFTPPVGLPDSATLYVTITLFFFDQDNIVCESQLFATEDIVVPPDCISATEPADGETDVAIATNINWDYVRGATGYRISIGTASGLADIVNNLDVGNTLTYNPINVFAYDTEIFVDIIPYNENGLAINCNDFSFVTASLGTIPSCASIISPLDGEINVGLSPLIEWTAVPDATGYIVNIGTTPFSNDVVDEGVFFTNSTFVINFEPNSIYFIQIIPFNTAGQAMDCEQTSFSTILGCGPFYDVDTGELVTLNPELTLATEVGLCLNMIPTLLNAPDIADGYRWYKLNANDDFVVISETESVEIHEEGIYRYEAYNYTDGLDEQIECPSIMNFNVVTSEPAISTGATVTDGLSGFDIEIFAEGNGDYEYSINSENGPYQDSSVFNNAPETTTVGYIRDKNGCGVVTINIENYFPVKGFPKFFTPNGDGFNDYWQYTPKDDDTFRLKVIYIYDRYGKLLKTLDPNSSGWTGRYNNYKVPPSDFWYRAETISGRTITGHFSLKR